MSKSQHYQNGQQARRDGKSHDDNPFFGAPSKAGIRRYTDEQAGSDWAVGFRDENETIRFKKHGPVPELRNFVRRVRCR